jgi:hypothetical protein
VKLIQGTRAVCRNAEPRKRHIRLLSVRQIVVLELNKQRIAFAIEAVIRLHVLSGLWD